MVTRDRWPTPEDCQLDFSDFEKARSVEIRSPQSEWITVEEHRAQAEMAVADWLKEEELLKGKVL